MSSAIQNIVISSLRYVYTSKVNSSGDGSSSASAIIQKGLSLLFVEFKLLKGQFYSNNLGGIKEYARNNIETL